MAGTKLYLHNALSSVTGTLPSTIQCALGAPNVSVDAASVNRLMDTSVGSSQTSKAASISVTNSKVYFTRFCTPTMTNTSLSADTWTFSFATMQSSVSLYFPYNTTGNATYICLYVWNPSNGTKVATILDANSGSSHSNVSQLVEQAWSVTFSGSAVASMPAGCILCFEAYFYQNTYSTNGTGTFYYDGTTEASTTTNAAYLSTPTNTITFGPSNQTYNIPIPDTVSLTESVKKKSMQVGTGGILETVSLGTETLKKKPIKKPADFITVNDSSLNTTKRFLRSVVDAIKTIIPLGS